MEAIKSQKKSTTTILLPLCQCDNYSVFKFLSQWKGKLVNVLTRWIWKGKAKNSWITTDLATTFPPDQNHTIPRECALENRLNQINLCFLRVSKFFNLSNFLLSGLLLQHWPKEKCVPDPRSLSFTVCSSTLLLIWPSSKIMRVFFLFYVTISCCCWDGHVTLLLTVVELGVVAAQDVGAQQLLSVRWWAIIFAGLKNFCESLMYWPAKVSRWL